MGRELGKNYGVCYHEKHTIEIDRDQSDKEELDTILHEALHGLFPNVREFYIHRSGYELRKLLWKLGYRKVK